MGCATELSPSASARFHRNDRPAGASRNARRGAWTADVGLRLTWAFGFGGPRTSGPRGPQMISVRVGGDEAPVDIGGGPYDDRHSLQFYAAASNLLNRLRPTRYGDVAGSSLFAQPVEAAPGRRVEIGARFRF